MHSEPGQPHEFVIYWTTAWTLASEMGGHFYLSQYGVRVEGASNTVVAWNPADWHGTSLHHISPEVGAVSKFHQSGLTICTPACLENLLTV